MVWRFTHNQCDIDTIPTMDPTCNSSEKRQKAATGAVESALFHPDVVFLLAALLDARDLCQVSLTCKTLGDKPAEYSGLSLVDEAARRQFECASEWERSCLPKYDDEGFVELYRHLLLLRSRLAFDQLVEETSNTARINQQSRAFLATLVPLPLSVAIT